jgi:hypothetical protein
LAANRSSNENHSLLARVNAARLVALGQIRCIPQAWLASVLASQRLPSKSPKISIRQEQDVNAAIAVMGDGIETAIADQRISAGQHRAPKASTPFSSSAIMRSANS